MKKIVALMVVMTIIFSFSTKIFAQPTFEPDFEVKSDAVLLYNLDTNNIMYEKNSDKALPPASLVKIMTAIIAIENTPDLEVLVTANVTVFNDIYGKNASNADIRVGEEVRMIDLLYALILQSACESAGIIAEHVAGGNQADFVDMMNAKAKEIGANNTYFTDPHGLDDTNQYTTAYDMFLITQYALDLPFFTEIASTQIYEMPVTNKHSQPRNVVHTNFMLSQNLGGRYYDSTVIGLKTGTTGINTKNLVTIASDDGYNYLLVVLASPIYQDETGHTVQNSYVDTSNIYEWAFDTFQMVNIIDSSFLAREIPVSLAAADENYVIITPQETMSAFLPYDIDLDTIEKEIFATETVEAPVKKGDVLGSLELSLYGEVIATVPLVASDDVQRSAMLYTLDRLGQFFSNGYIQFSFIAIIVIIILYIFYAVNYNKKKKKNSAKR